MTDEKDLIDKCYVFHNMGLGVGRGGVGIGTKYRMNEFEAAVLLPQLQTLPEQTATRNENARYLARRLAEIPGIEPQKLYPGATRGAYYLYGFRYLKEQFHDVPRDTFARALRAEGIPLTTMYFDRLNTQPFIENTLNSPTFRKIYSPQRLERYRQENHCPVNDRLSQEGIWLPQYVFLGTQRDMDDIADAVAKLYENRDQLARL